MKQEHVRKDARTYKQADEAVEQAEQDAAVAEAQAKAGADISDTDDLLDEIDAVLEENAEEFIRGYVQQGGQ